MMIAAALTDEDIPQVNWQGQALDCAQCPSRQNGVRCEPGVACVQDRYAKRVERFFKWNPQVSNDYLSHPYFEVRAIASRRADLFHLQRLIGDEDETVRLSVAWRLPLGQVARLRHDPHREVRIRVAMRLEGSELLAMSSDPDYYVRKLVAQRLPEALLPRLLSDPEWEVRLEVAKRLSMPQLLALSDDKEVRVRCCVASRLPPALLARMANDPAWEVRWAVAQRADAVLARQLASHDVEPEVREEALHRWQSLGTRSVP